MQSSEEGEIDVRDYLVKNFTGFVLGPAREDEELNESPLTRYLIGALYPAETELDPSEDDSNNDFAEDSESEDAEVTFPAFQTQKPTSIGLSCQVDSATRRVTALLYFGVYRLKEDGSNQRYRIPRRHNVIIEFEKSGAIVSLGDGAEFRWRARKGKDNSVYLTAFLVNVNKPTRNRTEIERVCIYQPVITLKIEGEGTFVQKLFQRFPGTFDPDRSSFDLLFRDKLEFAVGHGCSVDWGGTNQANTKEIWTTLIPTYEVPTFESVPLDIPGLSMKSLSAVDSPFSLKKLLTPLIDSYELWITKTANGINELKPELQPVAKGHISRCEEAIGRMKEGIRLLCEDNKSFAAFKFANEAMLLQISRQILNRESRQSNKRIERLNIPIKWRPFQLAFILLCIKGIVESDSADRKRLVDLLWFPTGGGKTEAYLGLGAFTLAYRRLRASSNESYSAGVTIIMRYTLRLLTIQQFQRAATLICACEIIRRQNIAKWGSEPFLIGLWVGQQATPNRFEDAVDILKEQQSTGTTNKGTPVQLHECPWCGTRLGPHHYWWDSARKWILVSCPRVECEFHYRDVYKCLPVMTVDEDIYHRLPALLISTVDKFAQIAWNSGVAGIFGKVDRLCPRHGFIVAGEDHAESHGAVAGVASKTEHLVMLPPPELIIQDELHLISGPLGTMVGLYEAAIDYLCSYEHNGERIYPKVIASTATIRRAGEQVSSLFGRETRIFPPSGLSSSDSFFARESADSIPGRLYVGMCASGRSMKFALDWVYASLMEYVDLAKAAGATIDPYWTLVGYFNSLRELGGALRLTEDDIPKLMDTIAGGTGRGRKIRLKEELTSWVPSSKIPDILDMLDASEDSGRAMDLLLATNMISVGVDIQRLGIMAVNGQPKTTSEYIQATNRIGRKFPGLVLTLYNWFRPRDMSHYERFRAYHSTLYRHVDANSITPFAPRARDRGLTALLIGMCRILDPVLTVNQGAHRFHRSKPVTNLVAKILIDRASIIEATEVGNMRKEIDAIWDWWDQMVRSFGDRLVYRMPLFAKQDEWHPLLRPADEIEPPDARDAPNSLRSVERLANLYYQERIT